jgi:signal transduction histidine kinase
VVWGDSTQLAQVFQNLIGNALKYRSPDPPRIAIHAEREASGEWLVSIHDNGIGIDPKHHERIFRPFQRLHGREFAGTGIGLALCRRIVESHGGRIWVESNTGSGSTFRFSLKPAETAASLLPWHNR